MATSNDSCHDAINTSLDPDQSDGVVKYDFDERIGMEIDSEYIYLSAYDKKNAKPVLLQNNYGQKRTPICVCFTDDTVLIGDSAFNEAKAYPNNTFQDFTLLLGEAAESTVCQGYAKYRNHTLFKRDNRCLLLIPSRDQYVGPEELLALLLERMVEFVQAKYKQRFSTLTVALGFQELQLEKKVRAHAEAATLAGLKDIRVVPRAAGQVNEVIRSVARYHEPNPGPFPFIVIDRSLMADEVSLVVVDDKVTSVEASTRAKSMVPVDVTFKWLLHHVERYEDCHLVGLVVNGLSSSNASSRSQLVSSLRDALAARSTNLQIRDVEDRGAACQGIVYDSKKQDLANLVLGKTGYSVEMAIAPSCPGCKDSIRLFGSDVNLPCHKSQSLTPSSSAQAGVLLCLFTRDNASTSTAGLNLLTEAAIEFPNPTELPTSPCTIDATMSSNHGMHFILRAADDRSRLASIHYSVDGLVRIHSAYLVPITPRIRREWLPRANELLFVDVLPADRDEGLVPTRKTDKGDRDQ
jgi:Hsp70 protein